MIGLSAVAEIVRDEVSRSGPLTFARFLEIALYQPELGYYRTHKKPVGSQGDFFTASQLQPVFSELVASFVGDASVLELGAGGRELSSVLHPQRYIGFDFDQDPLPSSFEGIIFANEFFDALPFHLLKKTAAGWRELFVGMGAEGFTWREGSMADTAVEKYAASYGGKLPEGSLLEVCLQTSQWLRRMAQILTRGNFLIVDYGYSASELRRYPQGTLMAYQKHQALRDVLSEPGLRDITAHVNFTYLQACARECSFEITMYSSLAQWAMHVWHEEELTRRWRIADERWRLLWKQIVFGFGETFRVLLLKK